ncbi:MAG: hypothetical protein AAGA56_12910 [Myxococcota bacterium]
MGITCHVYTLTEDEVGRFDEATVEELWAESTRSPEEVRPNEDEEPELDYENPSHAEPDRRLSVSLTDRWHVLGYAISGGSGGSSPRPS